MQTLMTSMMELLLVLVRHMHYILEENVMHV